MSDAVGVVRRLAALLRKAEAEVRPHREQGN
jgi:hypothetical protein